MKELGYYNGHYDELQKMMIPMNDRVCWFGDGVYDAGPCRNYKIFAVNEHIDRFFRSAEALRIHMPVTKQELKSILEDLVLKMDSGDLFVYYQVTRGTDPKRAHVFTDAPANLWITMTPSTIADGRTPIRLITMEDIRHHQCNIKTLNLIPNVIGSQMAKEAGCDEVVFIRPGNRVTECAHSNVQILQGGTLRTAPCDNLILPGIARAHLLRACAALGIPVLEKPFTKEELMEADEVIVTSSSHLCMRAEQIDGQAVGSKDPETYEKLRAFLLEEFYEATK